MTEQQSIAVEELLAVLLVSQQDRVEIPFEYFDPEKITGKIIAVDHDPENKVVVLSMVDAEDVELEEDKND